MLKILLALPVCLVISCWRFHHYLIYPTPPQSYKSGGADIQVPSFYQEDPHASSCASSLLLPIRISASGPLFMFTQIILVFCLLSRQFYLQQIHRFPVCVWGGEKQYWKSSNFRHSEGPQSCILSLTTLMVLNLVSAEDKAKHTYLSLGGSIYSRYIRGTHHYRRPIDSI